MENTIRLSSKDTKFLNKILLLSKQFDVYKKEEKIDTNKMYIILYKMRVIHGIMLARLNKYSNKLWLQMKQEEKTASNEYYNLSVYSGLIDSAKELINNAEEYLQKMMIHENKDKLKILHSEENNKLKVSDIETDIENDDSNIPEFILFHATWCGYCKQFMPIWKQFEKEMTGKNIKITSIDGDNDESDMCKKYKIKGYPTIILIMNKEIIEYNRPRTVEALHEFVLEKIDK